MAYSCVMRLRVPGVLPVTRPHAMDYTRAMAGSSTCSPLPIDLLIFGGGIAGLWLLDEARRSGRSVLLAETDALGTGQTIGAQGIIHGGLKYTFEGLMTESARAIRSMPDVWRDCLAGRREPDLSPTRLRGEHCYLWRTRSLASRGGMIGARVGLRIRPVKVTPEDRPAVLGKCPGDVFRVDEQVVDCRSLLENLAMRNGQRLLKIDAGAIKWQAPPVSAPLAKAQVVTLGAGGRTVTLQPAALVFAAGAGNESLCSEAGIRDCPMQRRPLHMAMVRSMPKGPALPVLNGHCTNGTTTHVTVTTDRCADGCVVWTVGGQVSEDGVKMEERELCQHVRWELEASIPGLDLSGMGFGSRRVDRAEPKMRGGRRPDDAYHRRFGDTIVAWPTKIALAPRLAEQIMAELPDATTPGADVTRHLGGWPRPIVATPYWETRTSWITGL